MKARELNRLGVPPGPVTKMALKAVARLAGTGLRKRELRARVEALVADPGAFREDEILGALATELADGPAEPPAPFNPRPEPAPWRLWGEDLDPKAREQMANACRLPVAARGALMPDAHLGYGLPIGGVLATRGAVIPYAVGVDIACRMKLTVLDLPVNTIERDPGGLGKCLEAETRFGIGASFDRDQRRDHEVLDKDWTVSPVTQRFRDKAWSQLGTSGSGNHFVEFGELTLAGPELGLEAGAYLALLSHSGSRGVGASVAGHYSKLAMAAHPKLPKQLKHLAWLDLDSEAGQEYWAAMNLMGEYAAAHHACIHHHVARRLGARVLAEVENHHNFAWKEEHDGGELIVHRKGATPAGEGVLGIIPGSMATPGFVVRGRGNEASLRSASHGAGRLMSRTQARRSFRWSHVRKFLRERRVTLLSAGLDEVPMAYKDIHEVMREQRDLVDRVARFDPRLVKMAPAGEKPED